jgi:hypothetical protein
VNAQRIIFAAALALSLSAPLTNTDDDPVVPGRRTVRETTAFRRADREPAGDGCHPAPDARDFLWRSARTTLSVS